MPGRAPDSKKPRRQRRARNAGIERTRAKHAATMPQPSAIVPSHFGPPTRVIMI